MTTPEAETIDELIADCADLPPALRTTGTAAGPAAPPPATGGWAVTEACAEQVAGLDDYV